MLHANRARAESFGEDAELYHDVRPRYPAAMFDHLLAGGPVSVLDVGCGTGIAAELLAARGCTVLGVEPDERMAAVARDNGIEVEIGKFESWDAGGRTFELLTSGQAWHWVEPVAGFRHAAEVLADGGRLGLFWNFAHADEPVASALNELYDRLAPELGHASMMLGGNQTQHARIAIELRASGLFTDPQVSDGGGVTSSSLSAGSPMREPRAITACWGPTGSMRCWRPWRRRSTSTAGRSASSTSRG